MKCRIRLHELSRYLDGELSPARARYLEDYIEECDHCQKRLKFLSEVKQLIGQLALPECA